MVNEMLEYKRDQNMKTKNNLCYNESQTTENNLPIVTKAIESHVCLVIKLLNV